MICKQEKTIYTREIFMDIYFMELYFIYDAYIYTYIYLIDEIYYIV